jgi:transcriptional regulator with XRE-family HTH domain
MADGGNPLMHRRRLRAELRKARQAKELTQEQVATEMEWSLSKIIRIEAGSSSLSSSDLEALLQLYGVTDSEQADALLALARAARERSWWSAYRDVAPPSLLQLIEYESAASVIRQFETMFVPGILQTEDYAHTVIQDYYNERPRLDQLSALVELRVQREELLDSDNPPSFQFVLDEAVVRRLVGGSTVMRRQLRRLIELAVRPHITVALIPFSIGLHPGMKGPFEIVEPADPSDRDIVFLERTRADIISDNPEETLSYRENFEELIRASLNPDDSKARLARIADKMS